MSILVKNCPRCGAQEMTFTVMGQTCTNYQKDPTAFSSPLVTVELFCICRGCEKSVVFVATFYEDTDRKYSQNKNLVHYDGKINDVIGSCRYIYLRDFKNHTLPDDLPNNIKKILEEALICLDLKCWNASGAMFRLCLDLATKKTLSDANESAIKDLSPRINKTIELKNLSADYHDLLHNIRLDGNDAAHDGTLTQEVYDLKDLTFQYLEDFYTRPAQLAKRLDRMKKNREERDSKKS